MSKFSFSVNGPESRHQGVIDSPTFTAAVEALGSHVDVRLGDVLEIGVSGFPPATYKCVGEIRSHPVWMPAGQLAA